MKRFQNWKLDYMCQLTIVVQKHRCILKGQMYIQKVFNMSIIF